jgi:Tfp pilus tip-associated adhesin PilY1
MNTFVAPRKAIKLRTLFGTFLTCLVSGVFAPSLQAAFDPVNDDTDIFLVNPNITSQRANVLLYVDNTANWGGQNTSLPFANEKNALVSVVNNLTDQFNLGLMLFPETGAPNDSVDGGYIRFGVRQMNATNKPVLAADVGSLDAATDKGNNNTLSEGMVEVFRYFTGGDNIASHGKIKSDYDGNTANQAFINALGDYPLSTSPSATTNYTSPIAHACQKNFLIYISNGPANENASSLANAETELAAQGYDTTSVIALTPNGQQGSWMDEWAKYLANADINGAAPGEPVVYTYVVEVDPSTTGQGPDMTALMKSVALNGKGKYFAVSSGNNGQAIVNALNQIFNDIQAVNSVFASTTLPVSVNVRGTNLNQVYIGVFRPDESKSPRWFGNLKMYVLGFDDATSTLFLADTGGGPAENPETGFINPTSASFWTAATNYWGFRTPEENGAGGNSDLPDGDLVEKGGVAEMLRIDHADGPDLGPDTKPARKLYTCTSGSTVCTTGSDLKDTPFDTSNDGLTAANFGLGTQPVTSLTGFATQTVTGLTDTKTLTSLATAAAGTTISSLTSAPNSQKTITNLTTAAAQTITALNNNEVIKSFDDLQPGAPPNKDPVVATIANHGYSTGQTVYISGVSASEYNKPGGVTITKIDNNNFKYTTGDSTPTNNPTTTSATVTSTSSIVTVTVPGHGFSTGQSIAIAGVTPSDYNDTYTVNVIDSNNFSFTTASALGPITSTLPGTATASGASTTATATATAHGYSNGDMITISGATPPGYNGTFMISGVTPNTFEYIVSGNLEDATGTILAANGFTVTATFAAAHGFTHGDLVSISGATQPAYNGGFTISCSGSDCTGDLTFTYQTNNDVSITPATTAGFLAATTGTSTTAIATLADHGLANGASVVIAGATPAGYDGTYNISKIDDNSFLFITALPQTPATVMPTVRLNTATVTAIANLPGHGYSTGNSITIEGAVDGVGTDNDDYNGTFTITKTSDNTFTYPMLLVTPQLDASGSINAKIKTTTAKARVVTHGFGDGDTVTIAGATPTAFNRSVPIAVVDADNFTYPLLTAEGDATGSIQAASGTGAGLLTDLINWVRGTDNFEDENADGASTDSRSSIHGDVLHSRPAVVNYNRHGNDNDVYIFYGANDGIFRAVKGGFTESTGTGGEPEPGEEAWGFIPEEFFSSLERLRDNEPLISSSNKKPYFADGTLGVYVDDTNNDNKLVAADGDKVWLFISMHRGGRLLYALDVSDPTNPKLMWKKSNNDTGWPELGQTWSAPTVRELAVDVDGGGPDDDDVDPILLFGAGYDPAVEDVPPDTITAVTSTTVVAGAATYTRSMGRGIFAVNAENGDIIWQAGPSPRRSTNAGTHPYVAVPGMDYSIPSDVVAITDRAGAIHNRAYVGDTGGNVWRIDIGDGDVNNWGVTKLASIANTGSIPDGLRKFLFPPDVVYSDDGYDAVLIGSGDREHPFDDDVVNRFYMFKDSGIGTIPKIDTTIDDTGGPTTVVTNDATLGESDLFDATSNCIQDASACSGSGDEANTATATNALTGADGWYITLGTGEKVVGNAVTLNEVVFFNTNQPGSVTTTSCDSDLGTARQYTVKFDDATAIADQNIDGTTDATDRSETHPGGGYLPSPVPVVVEIDGEVHEGVISGVSVDQPPGSLLNARLRKFWYKEME